MTQSTQLSNQRVGLIASSPLVREQLIIHLEKGRYHPIDLMSPVSVSLENIISRLDQHALNGLIIQTDDFDSLPLIEAIRQSYHWPLILLSHSPSIPDLVATFAAGADDYIRLPYDERELLARLTNAFRHYHPTGNQHQQLRLTNLIIDKQDHSLSQNGKKKALPPKELALLFYMASHPGQVFNRRDLLENVWHYNHMGSLRTVDVHIKRLRQKLAPPYVIKTVWGIGYKFDTTQPDD